MKEIDGYIAAKSILDVFYILRKDISDKDRRSGLLDLCEIFSVIDVDDFKVVSALKKLAFKDLEDCVQYLCAKEDGAEYIITRNVKDFVESDILAVRPDEFLKLVA